MTPVVTLESEDPSGGVRAKAVCTGSRENGQENGVRVIVLIFILFNILFFIFKKGFLPLVFISLAQC